MDPAPIVVFAYNRPEHLARSLASLQRDTLAKQSSLYCFVDGPKKDEDEEKINRVKSILSEITGFNKVKVTVRDKNIGLANSIITGVSDLFKRYEKLIVLEDDLLYKDGFISFMNEGLRKYSNSKKIYSITGYLYPIHLKEDSPDCFLLPRTSSWGWGTWRDRWAEVDWEVSDYKDFLKNKDLQHALKSGGEDQIAMLKKHKLGKIDSWAIRWSYHHAKSSGFCLFPKSTFIENIGNDGSGTHKTTISSKLTNDHEEIKLVEKPMVNKEATYELQCFFKPSLIRRLINLVTLP